MNAETDTTALQAITDRATLLAEIFDRVASGESIRGVLETTRSPSFPNMRTFWRWVAAEIDVRTAYELAVRARADVYAEQIIEIADEKANSIEEVQRNKLRVDARKWVASRLLPKRYGDRTILAGDPAAPIQIEANARDELMQKLLGYAQTADAAEKLSAGLNS